VGRVARAGRSGTAYSFVAPDELPFMIDLHLYLGRHIMILDPKVKVDQIDQMNAYFGQIPPGILAEDMEWIKEQINASFELKGMEMAVENAMKLYVKTRGLSSTESMRRSKEMGAISVHPLFRHLQDQDASLVNRSQLLEGIRNYKPQHTIFEARMVASETPLEIVEMMKNKRKIHEKVITNQIALKKEKEEPGDINFSNQEDSNSENEEKFDKKHLKSPLKKSGKSHFQSIPNIS